MIPLSGRFKGTFAKRLRERASKWQGDLKARIVIPHEHRWWAWQEFGTAGAGKGTDETYPIEPVNATKLAFPANGGTVLRDHVDHPGIAPRRSVTKSLPESRTEIAHVVHQAFLDGAADDRSKLQEVVVKATETYKEGIVRSLEQNVPGTRSNTEYPAQDGKLHGRTAAEVFDEQATVVDLSD